MELLEHGHTQLQLGQQDLSRDYGPGRMEQQTKQEYTAARRQHDHATVTYLEWADASVRCTGLGARRPAIADDKHSNDNSIYAPESPIDCVLY